MNGWIRMPRCWGELYVKTTSICDDDDGANNSNIFLPFFILVQLPFTTATTAVADRMNKYVAQKKAQHAIYSRFVSWFLRFPSFLTFSIKREAKRE